MKQRGRDDRDLWTLGVLPVLSAGALVGILGIYWDIAWHIDKGRDSFFTLPHDFVYTALMIVLLVSLYGLWRDRRETPFHLPLGRRRLHAGTLIVAAGAALVLAFAPLDDLWHRLFGIDVTLWGPMHLVGILGMTLGCFGGLVSARLEGDLARDPRRAGLLGEVGLIFGIVLIGWSVLVVAEYEFVVPQYPSFWHPVLLAGLPAFPLVLIARLYPRRWAATVAACGFTLLRIGIAGWLIAASHLDLAGFNRPAIPMLVPAGLAVDLLGSRGAPGWAAGLLSGAVTLVVNLIWINGLGTLGGSGPAWTRATMDAALLPALFLAAVAGAAGAAVAEAVAPGGGSLSGGRPADAGRMSG